jgi:hypothetical protein
MVVIRNSKNQKIMATLMAMPYKYLLNGKQVKMYSTNFLAIHRSLREKRLASVIIGE